MAPKLLFLRYREHKPVVTIQRSSLSEIEDVARQFFSYPPSAQLKFHMKFGDDELVQLDPVLWPHIYESVTSLWIELEELEAPQTSGCSHELWWGPVIGIYVKTLTGRTLSVTINTGASVGILKAIIQDQDGTPINEQRIIFAGKQLENDRKLESYNIAHESTMHLVLRLRGGKPVIYLYPPAPMSVHVSLSLISAWEFSAIYPLAAVKRSESESSLFRETVSWDVFAEPDGMLQSPDGVKISYLYWEALACIPREITTPPASRSHSPEPGLGLSGERFDPSRPILTPQNSVVLRVPADLTKYLDQALWTMGLHTEARTSFITYWLPSLMKHEYVALRFLEQSSYEYAARLDIIPKPDIVTRVFMLFRGVNADDLGIWTEAEERSKEMYPADWKTVVGVDIEGMRREDLFRVLEWGGMEVR